MRLNQAQIGVHTNYSKTKYLLCLVAQLHCLI